MRNQRMPIPEINIDDIQIMLKVLFLRSQQNQLRQVLHELGDTLVKLVFIEY